MTDEPDHLRIDVSDDAERAVVRLDGELDVHTAAAVSEAIAALGDGRAVVVDAAALRFCDSSGLQALVQSRDRLVRSGGSLTVEGVHGSVERVLSVTGLLDLFTTGS